MQEDFKSLKPEQLKALKMVLSGVTVGAPRFTDWFDGKKIDEIAFCEYMLRQKEPLLNSFRMPSKLK